MNNLFNKIESLKKSFTDSEKKILKYIKNNNGKIWIQDPETAEVDYMPRHAKEQVDYDLLINPEKLCININQLNI